MGFATLQSPTFMADFLRQSGGYAVIDGGLATELERHGADLNDPLWSATCLIHSPELIRRVHLDYLEAGASIIITASYQATIQGFEAKGLSREEAEALLRRSVEIACEARDIYHERCAKGTCLEQRPILVAASVGSYGAYLADGSEYSGHYGAAVTLETLKDFHRRRVQVLAESGADLIAFETIPNKLEAKAYAELLDEENVKIPAWFSFTSLDGINVVSGDSLIECASIADSCKQVVAVGINCTPPRFIHGLILLIQKVCYARFMFFLQGLIFKIDMVTLFSFPNSCEKLKDSFSTLILISMYLSILLLYEEDSFHYGECNSDRRKRDETQVTTKPVVIYPNSGETYDGVRKEWVKSSGVQDGDFVSYVGKWREAGASLFGGCCRTSPHTIRAISMTLSSYLQ